MQYPSLNRITESIFGFQFNTDKLPKIAQGGIISLFGLILFKVLNFAFQFLLARGLSPSDVGLLNLGFSITGLLGLIVVFGLDRAVVRYIGVYSGKGEKEHELGAVTGSLRIMILVVFVTTPIFFISAEITSEWLFNKPDLAPILKILILGIPFIALTRLLMAILQGYRYFSPMILIEQVLIPFLRIAALMAVLFALGGAGLAVAYSSTLVSIIGFVISLVVVWGLSRTQVAGIRSVPVYRELLVFSLPLLLASVLNRTNAYTETIVLGIYASSEQVGIFTISYKISVLLMVFFEVIHIILAPSFAKLHAQGNIQELSKQYQAVTNGAFALTLPAALFMFVEAPTIMGFFGPEYAANSVILQYLVIAQLASILIGPAALILIMTGYTYMNLVALIANLVLSLVLDFALIPLYGMIGAAVAGAITIVFVNILRLVQLYQALRIQPLQIQMLKLLVAGFVATLILLGAQSVYRGVPDLIRLGISAFISMTTFWMVMMIMQRSHLPKPHRS